jgi:hypothetical protein
MYWKKKEEYFNTEYDHTSIKSTMNIEDILKVILPAANDLRKILKVEIERKYPSVLTTKTLQNDINRYMADVDERTGGQLKKLNKRK